MTTPKSAGFCTQRKAGSTARTRRQASLSLSGDALKQRLGGGTRDRAVSVKPPSIISEIVAKLAGLTAAVVTPRDVSGDFLLRELQRLRIKAHSILPSAEPLPANADFVLCDYKPDLVRRIPWLTANTNTALIIILPQTEVVSADALFAAMPQAVLARPFTTSTILASILIARLHARSEHRMLSKIERVEENVRSFHTIERAKRVLMQARDLSDDEAYRHIRTLAMSRRVTVSELAAAIIFSSDFHSGDAVQAPDGKEEHKRHDV